MVVDYITRVEERFSGREKDSVLQEIGNGSELDVNPSAALDTFFEAYPQSSRQILQTEDGLHFLALCRRRGQKPVPFVPVLDPELEFWFKKDSLWQSEDIDAVVDQDPQRVCILQGPVAVRYSKKVDEPIKEILDDIYHEYIATLQKTLQVTEESIPKVDYLGGQTASFSSTLPQGVSLLKDLSDAQSVTFEVTADRSTLPNTDSWLELLSGDQNSWLRALLTTSFVVQGKMIAINPLRRVLRPRAQQRAQIKRNSDNQIIGNGNPPEFRFLGTLFS